jgi:hypothetical protein
LSRLKLLPSNQTNLSPGEIKVSRGLMQGLGWRMNLTSNKRKGMGPDTGFLWGVQGLNASRQRNPVSQPRVLGNGNNSYLRPVRHWTKLLS